MKYEDQQKLAADIQERVASLNELLIAASESGIRVEIEVDTVNNVRIGQPGIHRLVQLQADLSARL